MTQLKLSKLRLKPVLWLVALTMVGPAFLFISRICRWYVVEANAFGITFGLAAIVLTMLGWSLTRRDIFEDKFGLKIRSTFYQKAFAYSDVRAIQRLRLGRDKDVIGLRVNGLALPGLRSGWFRLREQRRAPKLFVDVTSTSYLLLTLSDRSQLAIEFEDNELAYDRLFALIDRSKAAENEKT